MDQKEHIKKISQIRTHKQMHKQLNEIKSYRTPFLELFVWQCQVAVKLQICFLRHEDDDINWIPHTTELLLLALA